MNEIEKMLINGKTYQVQTLGVLDTFSLHLEVTQTLGKAVSQIANIFLDVKNGKEVDASKLGEVFSSVEPEKIIKLQKKVLKQVITPENTFLSDDLDIEKWFGKEENSGDLWEVFLFATKALVGKYLPNSVKGMLDQMKTAKSAQ